LKQQQIQTSTLQLSLSSTEVTIQMLSRLSLLSESLSFLFQLQADLKVAKEEIEVARAAKTVLN
jgi:hypothetical protein